MQIRSTAHQVLLVVLLLFEQDPNIICMLLKPSDPLNEGRSTFKFSRVSKIDSIFLMLGLAEHISIYFYLNDHFVQLIKLSKAFFGGNTEPDIYRQALIEECILCNFMCCPVTKDRILLK
jgi:hypothetical protein